MVFSKNVNFLHYLPDGIGSKCEMVLRYLYKKQFLRVQGPIYRFPSRIDFKKCREEIASALKDFGNRWYKREYVEPNALKEWKVSIFKIVNVLNFIHKILTVYPLNLNPLFNKAGHPRLS